MLQWVLDTCVDVRLRAKFFLLFGMFMWQRHVGVFYILLRIEMGSEQIMRRTAFLMTNALWGVQGLCISTADLVSYPHVLEITSGGGTLGLCFQLKGCSPKAVNKISLVVTRQEVLGGVERHLQYMTYMTWCLPSLLCNTFLFTIYSVNNRLSFILHATYLSLSNKSYFTRWTRCYVKHGWIDWRDHLLWLCK